MKTQQTTMSEVSLIYRSKVKASDRPQVKCSRDAYKLSIESWHEGTIEFVEEFKILLLYRSDSVLGILDISKGGISGKVTDVRLIFQAADIQLLDHLILTTDDLSDMISDADPRLLCWYAQVD